MAVIKASGKSCGRGRFTGQPEVHSGQSDDRRMVAYRARSDSNPVSSLAAASGSQDEIVL